MVNARTVFYLGDDVNVVTAVIVEELTQGSYIIFSGNKRCGYEIHSVFDTEQQILLILFTQIFALQNMIWEIHTLAVRHFSAHDHFTVDRIVADAGNFEREQTIVHKDRITDIHLVCEVLVADRNTFIRSDTLLRSKCKRIAVIKVNLVIFKRSDPVFRSFGIEHYRYGEIQVISYLFQGVDLLLMLLMCTVGEIQPRYIHSCQTHLPEYIFLLTCRTYRADDLSLSHAHPPRPSF